MWIYQGKEYDPSPEDMKRYVGFVYIITHLGTGKRYVGKKLFQKKKRVVRNKKKKSVLAESDWRSYTGSSRQLNEDIESDPRIKKEILHLARTKGELSYLEMLEQIERDVLRDDSYYNSIINVRISSSHLPKE